MPSPNFGFDHLVGSDPAGYTSINTLIDSVDSILNSSARILPNGLATTSGYTLVWNNNALTTAQLNTSGIANNAITEAKIINSAVTESKIANDAVTSSKIANNTIVNADINSSAAISYSKLALSSSIQTSDFAAGATAPKATDLTGSTVGLVYQQGTDDTTAIANGANGQILQLTGGAPVWANVSGLSIDTTNIANNAITNDKLRDSSGFSIIGKASTGSGDPGDIIAGTPNTVLKRPAGTSNLLFSTVEFNDLAAVLQEMLNPVGTVQAWAGSTTTPSGWLLCEGQQVAIATYQALYNVLTNTGAAFPYGANTNGSGGAGSTHFRLPDLRGRTLVGAGTGTGMGVSGTGTITGGNALAARNLGAWFGDERLASHTHTITDGAGGHSHGGSTNNDGSHSHSIGLTQDDVVPRGTGVNFQRVRFAGTTNTDAAGSHSHGISTNSDGGHNHTINNAGSGGQANTQPSFVLNYIIKV